MPALQTAMTKLNSSFAPGEIDKFATSADKFAPGKTMDAGLITQPGTVLHKALESYIATLPGSFHESLRSVIYYALTQKPPIPVTFSWAPGYDYEFNLWHAPDAAETRGGITVMIKSRYPADPHPLQK